jgi:hypothetical protein
MSLPVKSQQDLYTLWVNTLQAVAPQLTDTLDGSIIDGLAGVFSVAGQELTRQIILQFNKTFISLANGPEVTRDADDLQTLATDHFGSAFGRPEATEMTDTATFSRANNSAGAVTIPTGTIVKTKADALGNQYRYATIADVTLTNNSSGTDLSVTVGITAVVAGKASNAAVGTITVIESSLLDSSIVVTNAGSNNGTDAATDAEYRTRIYNLLQTLRGATRLAIESAAKAVSGVAVATALEIEQTVMPWNTSTNAPVGGASYFRIPFVTLYIADSGGTASPTLIANVTAAIDPIRALGVNITVAAASTLTINWTAALTLNPLGPNYATLVSDTTLIKNTMQDYVAGLAVGTSFIRSTARTAILAIWGPSGSNDLTDFQTTLPAGDVSATSTQKCIPGTIATA